MFWPLWNFIETPMKKKMHKIRYVVRSENSSPHFALCSVAFKLCLLESKQHKLLKSSKSKQQLPLAHCLDQSEKSKQNGHCKQEIWKFPSTKQTKILNVDQPVYFFESSKWSKLELVGQLSTISTSLVFFSNLWTNL